MKMVKNKIMSIILAAVMGVSVFAVPTYATEEMTVSEPRYFRVENSNIFDEVEAPVNGKINEISGWGNGTGIYSPITGTIKSTVDIKNGSGKDAILFGAVYDATENNLIRYVFDRKDKSASDDTLSVTTEISDTNQVFKTFIFDTELSLNSYTGQYKAPIIKHFYCDDPGTVTVSWYDEGGDYKIYKNGTEVSDNITTKSAWTNHGKYPIYIYTDTSAGEGDKYVVKNNGIPSDELVAHFENGAYIIMDKYVIGRNMAYLRNDDARWDFDSVSKHMIVDGVECDTPVSRETNYTRNTHYYVKVNPNFISGSGNVLDVKIDYYDKGYDTLYAEYYPDSEPSTLKRNQEIVKRTNSNTWKSATYHIIDGALLRKTGLFSDSDIGYNAQMRFHGGIISKIELTRYPTITNLRAENVYANGAEIRWNTNASENCTGYTIKRNGTTVATNYQDTVYYDRTLDYTQTYTYTVTAEVNGQLGKESSSLEVKPVVLYMALPVSSDESNSKYVYEDPSGISFGFDNNDRWNESMTVARYKGDKWARMTIARNPKNSTNGGLGWYDIYNWSSSIKSDLRSTYMSFKVDNSKISSNTRNVKIEFDYFDDSDGAMNGQYIQIDYLAYNNGSTSKKVTTTIEKYAQSATWKTASITLNDAQFDHNTILQGGYDYDFRLYVGGNRGGFSSTYMRVLPQMPQ